MKLDCGLNPGMGSRFRDVTQYERMFIPAAHHFGDSRKLLLRDYGKQIPAGAGTARLSMALNNNYKIITNPYFGWFVYNRPICSVSNTNPE
jgi:hypothetical protein